MRRLNSLCRFFNCSCRLHRLWIGPRSGWYGSHLGQSNCRKRLTVRNGMSRSILPYRMAADLSQVTAPKNVLKHCHSLFSRTLKATVAPFIPSTNISLPSAEDHFSVVGIAHQFQQLLSSCYGGTRTEWRIITGSFLFFVIVFSCHLLTPRTDLLTMAVWPPG